MLVGVTVQVAPVVPAQVPPVQMRLVAAGVQVAVSVELPPAVIEAGLALRVHTGVATLIVNVAVTLWAALMLTVQLPVPLHAPPQPVKVLPVAGVAVRVTLAPLLNDALQVEPQLMPAGVLVTVPVPLLLIARTRVVVTVTMALAAAPVPPALVPATV